METVKAFIWEWRYVIIFLALAVVYAIVEWKETKARLYALMLQAKRYAKDQILKTGDQQVEWILKKAFQFLPATFRIFLSEDLLRKLIKWLYGKLKDYMDDGKLNDSIKE